MNIVYLNGKFLSPDEATVSAFDRGFIFGDGVYEVMPVFGGRLFRLRHHLRRLEKSLAAIGLPAAHAIDEWNAVFSRLIEGNGGGDLSLYLQITRGAAPRDHGYPAGIKPTVFAYAQKLVCPDAAVLSAGVSAIVTPDIRWQRCDIKAIALLSNVMLRQHALEQGAAEAILVRDGRVTEGAASNIFIVKEGRIITPSKGPHLLPGVTRDLVLELARAHAVPSAEMAITEAELPEADEIWLTSSTKEILPVTRINGRPVAGGVPGPMFTRIYNLYQEYKNAFRAGHAD